MARKVPNHPKPCSSASVMTCTPRACRSTGEYTRRDLSGDVEAALRPLVDAGYRDQVVAPLKFLTGQNHVATFASRDGFTEEHLRAISLLIPPLARLGEIFALLRTATNLLSTYVGRNAGSRILGGQIQLGDTDTLRAVIWFSDLRGFTSLAQRVGPAKVIRALLDAAAESLANLEVQNVARTARGEGRGPDPLRRRAALRRDLLRQHRRRKPPRLHVHRPGGQPRSPAGDADQHIREGSRAQRGVR